LPRGRIGDEESEPALYLRSNPNRSMLVDAISLRHPLDLDGLTGQWVSKEGYAKVVLYFLIWAVAIALTGYGILRTFDGLR
jgi:hypothetical protein